MNSTGRSDVSIIQTAELLNNLVKVIDKKQEVPDEIDNLVKELLAAHDKFIEGIDYFMHSENHTKSDTETIKIIINTCPQLLSTKDEYGYLPIHAAACSKNTSHTALLAMIGFRNGIGGRGGLLVKDGSRYNVLQYIASSKVNILTLLEDLRNADPPLLLKEDVAKYCLLHFASCNKFYDRASFFADLDPECLFLADKSKGALPLHYACSRHENIEKYNSIGMAKFCIERAIQHNPKHSSIGGLFAVDKDKRTALRCMIDRYGEQNTWECIEHILLPYENIPILQKVIEYEPDQVNLVLDRIPQSFNTPDEQNRLPIDIAAANGFKWEKNLHLSYTFGK